MVSISINGNKLRLETICKSLIYPYFVYFYIYFILRYNTMLRKPLFIILGTITFQLLLLDIFNALNVNSAMSSV